MTWEQRVVITLIIIDGEARSPSQKKSHSRHHLLLRAISRLVLTMSVPSSHTNGTAPQTNGHSPSPLRSSPLHFTQYTNQPISNPKHGHYMLTVPYSRATGWGEASIGPRKTLQVDPLSGVCQYAVTCFEGMKVGPTLTPTSCNLRTVCWWLRLGVLMLIAAVL